MDSIFGDTSLVTPATFTNAAGVTREINVIYSRENTLQTSGDFPIQSAQPSALCRRRDVFDADINCSLKLHSQIEIGNGNNLKTKDNNILIFQNVKQYYILLVKKDESETTTLDLSEYE